MQPQHNYIKHAAFTCLPLYKNVNYLGVQGFNNPEMEAAILKMWTSGP